MKRHLLDKLLAWKQSDTHLPIILRGARQVGKTHLVTTLGQEHFEHFVPLNFELDPELAACFSSLSPQNIIRAIELVINQRIVLGKTLLFLDEVQECPQALMALRYFKEQLPELHIIAAGSLLEFTLQAETFRMPVGRVQFFHLGPLTFKEFLYAKGENALVEYIESYSWQTDTIAPVHNKLLDLVREYTVVGGMPAVVAEYVKEVSWQAAQDQQSILLSTYQNDFGKYARQAQIAHLQLLFRKIPGLVTRQFKYVQVSQDIPSRTLKVALQKLVQAGLVYPVFATSAAGLPLNSTTNEKKLKLLFLDIGLVSRTSHLNIATLLQEEIMLINQGALVEQFVGQELLAYQDVLLPPELHFWARDKKGSQAEVDYVIALNGQVVPIEVKPGATGRLKSLQQLMQHYDLPYGVQLAACPLEKTSHIIKVPLYLTSELPRLYHTC